MSHAFSQLNSFFYQHIIVVRGDSLWHLCMCLKYILIGFTLSSPLILIPHPLRRISTEFHTPIQSTYTIFTLLHLSIYPSHTHWYPLPRQDHFTFLSFIFFCVYRLFKGFCLGISHTYISYFNQINSHYYLFFLYCPAPLLFNSLTVLYILLSSNTDCVSVLSTIILFSSPTSP
jgi:hypothetical protein